MPRRRERAPSRVPAMKAAAERRSPSCRGGRPTARAARRTPALLVLLVAATATAGRSPGGTKHPPLVAGAEARCATCHAEVLKGRTVHPGVEACARCHEVSGSGAQTTVRLVLSPPELCVGCHPGFADAASGKLAAAHAPVVAACSNCHLPHAAGEPGLLKAPARDLCLSCHEADGVARAHFVPLGGGECGACHAPHGSRTKGMLAGDFVHAPFGTRSCAACHHEGRAVRAGRGRRSSLAATCFACHSDLEGRLASGVVHSPAREGRCTACHDPHLSSEPGLVKAAGAALCAGCHADVARKANAAGGHAPARKSCLSCHDAHRSERRSLLSLPVPELCARCHDPKGEELRREHLGADLAKLDCASCHDPHGSGAGRLFLGGSVHAPFAGRRCESCHPDRSAPKTAPAGGRALCTGCHPEVEEGASKAKVRHAALDGDCTLCHAPHVSARSGLVKGGDGEACGWCHVGQVPGAGEVAHGVIASLGCEACHEPHGGAEEKLLRRSGDGLCLACHDAALLKPAAGTAEVRLLGRFAIPAKAAAAIRAVAVVPSGPVNHPVGGHRSSGPPPPPSKVFPRIHATFQGEMRCLTCHDPHKGKSSRLLVKGAATATESCLQCHPR